MRRVNLVTRCLRIDREQSIRCLRIGLTEFSVPVPATEHPAHYPLAHCSATQLCIYLS